MAKPTCRADVAAGATHGLIPAHATLGVVAHPWHQSIGTVTAGAPPRQ